MHRAQKSFLKLTPMNFISTILMEGIIKKFYIEFTILIKNEITFPLGLRDSLHSASLDSKDVSPSRWKI